MKNISIFVLSYIVSKGGIFCLLLVGIFCFATLNIYGFVPPRGALMRPLPLDRCKTAGKAKLFFFAHNSNDILL
jgi:hypothetical protein